MRAPLEIAAAPTPETASTRPGPTRPGRADPGPWQVEVSYGRLNAGDFTDIIFQTHKTTLETEQLGGIAFGREIVDIGYGFSIEAGAYFGRRFDEGGVEFALPITFVFDGFPWRDRLPMRLRAAIGPSYITKITPTERRKDDDNQGSKVLNMFNPEIEIGLPGAPEWSGFFRLHHRSGIFGLIDGVTGGSTYLVFGLRHRFDVDAFE